MTVDRQSSADHVVVFGRDGQAIGESWCGSYAKEWRFLSAFQNALRKGDRAKVASLVLYPFHWNRSTRKAILQDKGVLLDRYPEVFTPAVVERVTHIDPRGLFCNSSGFMIGNGDIWANLDFGRYGVTTLNAA